MPTLEEEFDEEFVTGSGLWKMYAEPPQVKAWFKSYLKDFMESVKLEKKQGHTNQSTYASATEWSYNQALLDQEAKIATELKRRGIK